MMKLGFVVVYVNDLEASKDFWIEKCQFKLTDEIMMSDNTFYNLRAEAGSNIQLVPLSMMEGSGMNTTCPSLLFTVDNLEEEHARLKSVGVKVLDIEEHPIGKVFTMFDNEGNAFAVK